MREQTRGEFGGLGIEVTQEDGFVKVVSPMDDTPAFEAGIEAGDFITHVDGESLLGLGLDDAVEMMRGPVGSEIVITVVREGESEPFDVSIIRDTIELTVVRSRVEGSTVVLRLSTFNDQTYPKMKLAIEEEVEKVGGIDSVNGFVIDLRNNPGGLLNQAIAVSDAFLEKGEIVSTRGRELADGDRVNATPGDLTQGKPIVVLINGGSASASEIVAGALQDHRRAIVIGTKSFGKGSVQTVMPLRGSGAMRLTTARYYTPSGRSIQALGVSPDIVVAQPPARPETDEETPKRRNRTEADLRGSLNNDSLTEDQIKQIMEDRAKAERRRNCGKTTTSWPMPSTFSRGCRHWVRRTDAPSRTVPAMSRGALDEQAPAHGRGGDAGIVRIGTEELMHRLSLFKRLAIRATPLPEIWMIISRCRGDHPQSV